MPDAPATATDKATDKALAKASFRPATVEDCRDIAALFRLSSEGMSDYIWSQMAEPGESLEDVGARRYARTGVDFSYENCTIAEFDGAVLGMMHAYAMLTPEEATDLSAVDPVLRPAAELEDFGSFYISGLALVADARGLGLGKRFIDLAGDRARDLGLARVSLLCFAANRDALRLYLRLGFREIDRRAVVPHEMIHPRGDILLMVREVD